MIASEFARCFARMSVSSVKTNVPKRGALSNGVEMILATKNTESELNRREFARLAHLPPYLRHVAQGKWGRYEDRPGAFTAREQQDHTGCLYAGSGFQ